METAALLAGISLRSDGNVIRHGINSVASADFGFRPLIGSRA